MSKKRQLPLASSWVRYGLVVVIAVTICVFTVADAATVGLEADGGPVSHGPFGIDIGPLGWFETATYAHGMAYGGLTASLAYAVVAPTDSESQRRLVGCVVVAVVYGTVLELLQGNVASRSVETVDFLANTIGASLMGLCWWWLTDVAEFVPRTE
ncbi:VanZ family protein [Halocatena salina]|uniref:VanZ family protein n=1 Tax=Halocatena salina TaxID=2934340 RepID=A0A8U0A1L5_9EURY|nr:VanZ family protein [Halocatena salina]UPM41943.1 VanZ family protein [Halocatena salina]